MLHLVNYRAGQPARGVEVRLRTSPGWRVRSVRLASPEHEKDVAPPFRQAAGTLTFIVPEIRTYEIAVVDR